MSEYTFLANLGNEYNNSIRVTLFNLEKYNKDEITTYSNNIKYILKAIPDNIPDQDILSKNPINSITYYVDYAKIIYDFDKKVEYIDNKFYKNLGRRYINQF